jgi:hypothetical protein
VARRPIQTLKAVLGLSRLWQANCLAGRVTTGRIKGRSD